MKFAKRAFWSLVIDTARVIDAVTSLLSLGFAGTALAWQASQVYARILADETP